jgi:hypothetical protein
MLNKLTLTSELIHHFPDAPSLDDAMLSWWSNLREGGGLRLTEHGYDIFKNMLECDSYEYETDPKILTPRNLILLDRYLTCPYYLFQSRKGTKIILFGSKEALMAALYGDIKKFILSLTY